jgi:aminocarboxymuconate-semialdehyde decarboxylase
MVRIVDVHTHVYTPAYLDLLRKRSVVPRVLPGTPERLVILPGEDKDSSTAAGRPVGPEYSKISEKLAFMDLHGIDHSVISLANPWLDWLSLDEGVAQMAATVNDELAAWCTSDEAGGRLSAFAVLPIVSVQASVDEVKRITQTPLSNSIRGVIMGSLGAGEGLDDPVLEPLWETFSATNLVVFVHPHYHLPSSVYGPQPTGHVLPLAIGFPVETSLAIARLILAGVLERHPTLRMLIAHSGGVLPFLAARLDSCVSHDAHLARRLPKPPSHYLSKLYYDAVGYGPAPLKCLAELLGGKTGQILFGTDHPFFPPLEKNDDGTIETWESVESNVRAVKEAFGTGTSDDSDAVKGVLGGNAVRILGLP